jgi:hypothetical protein
MKNKMPEDTRIAPVREPQDILAFVEHYAHGGWPEPGETFARGKHVFEVVECGNVAGVSVLIFQSHCLTCGEPFRAVVNWAPMGLPVGACAEHRLRPRPKQAKPARRPKPAKKAKAAPAEPALGNVERHVMASVDAMRLVEAHAREEELIVAAVASMPRPEGDRDVRRQHVRRALAGLCKRGLLHRRLMRGGEAVIVWADLAAEGGLC